MSRYMILIDRDMEYGRITPNYTRWGDVVEVTRQILSNPPEGFNFFVIMRAESDAQLELAWERLAFGHEDLDQIIKDPRLALATMQTNTAPNGNWLGAERETTPGTAPRATAFSFLSQGLLGLQNKTEEKPAEPAPEPAPYVPEEGTPEWNRWEFARRMVKRGVITEFPAEQEVED